MRWPAAVCRAKRGHPAVSWPCRCRASFSCVFALAGLETGSLVRELDAWRRVEQLAGALGRVTTRVSAMQAAASLERLGGGRPNAQALMPAIELADAYGLLEQRAWLDYAGAELALLDGDSDGALGLARSAIRRGEANAYSRLIVRAWFLALPIIAGAPADPGELRRAESFLNALDEAGVPKSPYAAVMVPAARLHLARALAAPAEPPDPSGRTGSFRLPYAEPSWTLAVETVIGAWLEAGWFDAADRALAELHLAVQAQPEISLARASLHLIEARLLAARGADGTEVRERANLAAAAAREAFAPLWERAAEALSVHVDRSDHRTVEPD